MNNSFCAELNDGYKVTNTSGKHTWISDEPEVLGGTDLGPNPKDLLLSSLASCKLITMKMYAKRKEFEVTNISIEMYMLENIEGFVIRESINIKGNLTQKEKDRMIEISKRCPISKMLQSNLNIQTI